MPTGGSRTVKVRFDGDSKGLDQAAGKGSSALSKFGNVAKKTAAVFAVGLAVAAGATAKAVKAASDLNETMSKTSVVFGKSTDKVVEWSNLAADALGQSQQAALDGASTFALYGKQAKFSGDKLADFSISMSELASDMASFSNTSPEEAIAAIGSAFRGESDPIEKYGVLINEARLKDVAFRKGLIKTKSAALDPQTRVLAVQAALFEQLGKKGSGTIGDFARTSEGLANQQRILGANFKNLQASIGAAFLPVVQQLVTELNQKLIPALNVLWATHGPRITAFIQHFGSEVIKAGANLKNVDFAAAFDKIKAAIDKAGPALDKLKSSGGSSLSDSLKVTGVVTKFLAEHIDLLAKALPFLVAGLIAYKSAQALAHVAALVALPTKIAEVVVNRQLVKSNRQLVAARAAATTSTVASTGATVANTAAESTGVLTRARSVVGMVAQRVAMVAVRTATLVWVAAQWLLNVALTANPIGLIIVAIAALIAIIVIIATKTTWFQTAWQFMVKAVAAAWNWLWKNVVKPVIDFMVGYFKFLISIVMWAKDKVVAGFKAWMTVIATVIDWFKRLGQRVLSDVGKLISFLIGLPGKIKTAFVNLATIISAPFKTAFNRIADLWNGTVGKLSFSVPGWVPGLGGKSFSLPKLPHLDTGGFVRSDGLAVIHRGETVVPAETSPLGAGGGWPDTIVLEIDLGDGVTERIEAKLDQHERGKARTYRQTGGRRPGFGSTAGAMA